MHAGVACMKPYCTVSVRSETLPIFLTEACTSLNLIKRAVVSEKSRGNKKCDDEEEEEEEEEEEGRQNFGLLASL